MQVNTAVRVPIVFKPPPGIMPDAFRKAADDFTDAWIPRAKAAPEKHTEKAYANAARMPAKTRLRKGASHDNALS